MCDKPTNPLSYLNDIGISNIFRFILTHPDMDHMDGFDALCSTVGMSIFWDSGVRRPRPNFGNYSPYKEADWDRYVKVRDGKESSVQVLAPRSGWRFHFANKADENTLAGGDGLYILAPDEELVKAANNNGDINDGSYVLLYRSAGGRILMPGDAHDNTWRYVIDNYREDIEGCAIMIAPHHGRDSDRDYEFLDVVQPKLTLFGCAPSKHRDYNAWRGRSTITSNQAGNIVLDCSDGSIKVYAENETFARASNPFPSQNKQGYYYITTITE